MIKKTRKIKRSEFPQDFHMCNKYHSSSLLLLRSNQENKETETKFSFIVSKKVSKSAVKRFFLKRVAYNSIKNLKTVVKPGFFCVFHLKKGSEILKSAQIEDEIVFLLKKAEIIE